MSRTADAAAAAADGADAVDIAEQELREQERGLAQMEDELAEQELALITEESTISSRHRALVEFSGYVNEREEALLKRAEALGGDAVEKVRTFLDSASASRAPTLIGAPDMDARMMFIERRRAIYEARLELLEAREQALGERAQALEAVGGSAGAIEEALVRREQLLGEAARGLFTGQMPVAAEVQQANTAEIEGLAARPAAKPSQTKAGSPRAKARLAQVRVTLEARLEPAGSSTFFIDDEHVDGDLPGFFHATPNLLKVGREIRLRLSHGGEKVEAAGLVRWHRQRGQGDGPPGMAIQFFDVEEADRGRLLRWCEALPPVSMQDLVRTQ